MRVGAGVLHYQNVPGAKATLDALLAQTRPPDFVVVVEHASGDGSAELIREAYPAIEVVEVRENRGPGAGFNTVIRALLERDADAVLVLTDDLELAPEALEHLAARLEAAPELGAAGPLVAHQDDRDRVFYAGGRVRRHNWSLEFHDQPSELAEWKGSPPHPSDFLEIGGLLMRSAAVRASGVFDERFYYWADDVDYTLRMASLGWKLECVPGAVAWQHLASPPWYLIVRNSLGVISRNAPRRYLARELVRTAYWLARDALRPHGPPRETLRARGRGLVDFCRGRWGPPPEHLAAVRRTLPSPQQGE